MKYPKESSHGSEPEEIRVGDMIWWNSGTEVGLIKEVLEAPDDYERWGLSGPSVVLTNWQPFHAEECKSEPQSGRSTNEVTIVYRETQLDEEGIGLLSEEERNEVGRTNP